MSNAAAKSTTKNIDALTEEFIKEVQKKGLVRTFEWMHGWFDQVAAAQLRDELVEQLDEHANDKDAQNLYLMQVASDLARSISNHSTSASSNLMRQARLSAAMNMIDRNHSAYGSRTHMSKQWDVLLKRD